MVFIFRFFLFITNHLFDEIQNCLIPNSSNDCFREIQRVSNTDIRVEAKVVTIMVI